MIALASPREKMAGCGEYDCRQEVADALVISCGDSSDLSDPPEETFHEVAARVGFAVERPLLRAVGPGRIDRGRPGFGDLPESGIGVVHPVGGHRHAGLDLRQHRLGLRAIGGVAAKQAEDPRLPLAVDDRVGFRSEQRHRTGRRLPTSTPRSSAVRWFYPLVERNRSASSAAMQPIPAAVTACRYT